MPYKDALDANLASCLNSGYSPPLAARKVFGFTSSPVLQDAAISKPAFEILNAVADRFAIPFRAVMVVGSGHTGYSYFKKRDFTLKISDLDLAIVDTRTFCRYSELAFNATHGYSDLTSFKDSVQAESFKAYLTRGIFRPDKMPNCAARRDWFTYFGRLTMTHSELFSSINCGIYQSDVFFEAKQSSIVAEYQKVKA